MNHKDRDRWQAAMDQEINQLHEKGCWRLVKRADLPPSTKITPGQWVYKKKELPDSNGYLAKARWVIRGNLLDKDYMERYAPVITESTSKLLFALTAIHGWHIRQGDAVLAYLNGKLPPDKPVYMTQPLGYETGQKGQYVCELIQALYGLTPSARIWYDTLSVSLKEFGFKCSNYDSGLWIHQTRKNLYVTTYVDDFKVIAATADDADWFMDTLAKHFDIKDLGEMKRYLGVNVKYNQQAKTLSLSQSEYAEDLVTSFGLSDAHPVQLPMDPGLIIDDDPDPTINVKEYQRGVGCLAWLATKTHPDLSRTVGVLSQWNSKPTKKAWAALKHALRYLKGTINQQITYRGSVDPITNQDLMPVLYSDSDWGGPLTGNRRSVSGYILILAGAPIAWRSQCQTSVALSSNEAEYMAASEATRDAVWIRNIIKELEVISPDEEQPFPPVPLLVDNQGALQLIASDLTTKRSKHIDIRFHYVREKLHEGVIEIKACHTSEMAADGLTKPLRNDRFTTFLKLIGMKGRLLPCNTENSDSTPLIG